MYKRYLAILVITFFSGVVYNQTRTLDFYLNEGIKNSPLLKDFNNQINSALIDSLLIRSSKMPQVEARSQVMYSPYYKNFGYDEAITDGGNYTGVVGVTQNIFNRTEINNKYQSVTIQRQSVNNSSKISVIELKRIITEQYLAAFADFNEITFNKSFLEFARQECEIIRQFVNQGLCKQTDYLALLIETQTQEILVSYLSSQYVKDMRQLNQLCGLNDSSLYNLTLPDLLIDNITDLNKSPLIIQYKIDSLKIENEKDAIDVRYKPKVNWFADAGFLSSTPWNFYTHFGYSAGLSLSIPIYDGNQRDHEKKKLSLAENTRSAYENNFKNKFSQQILELTEELNSVRVRTSLLQKQLTSSEQLVNAFRSQLEKGIIQMTEYLNALKNHRFITKNMSDNKVHIQQVINELNYLLSQ
jgi:outer membrane protein TolC